MKRYRFVNAVYTDAPETQKNREGKDVPGVGRRRFSPGDEVSEGEVLPGSIASMLYTGDIVDITQATTTTTAPTEQKKKS